MNVKRTEANELSNCVRAPWLEQRMASGMMMLATYRTDEANPAFAGNPTVTCLPCYPSEAVAQAELAHQPSKRHPDFLSLSSDVRAESSAQIKQVFVPTAEHVSGLRSTMRLIREGYLSRNLLDPEFMNHLHRISLSCTPIILPRVGDYCGSTGGMALIGPTGSGKTCFINRSMTYVVEKARLHQQLGGRPCSWAQIPIVRISAAGQPSERQLALAIANQVDLFLDAKFEEKMSRKSGYVRSVAAMLASNLVALLIIDDVQLWGRMDKRLRINLLNFLVGVLEESRVPIMCSGTMLLKDVLEAHISQGEKLIAEGEIALTPILRPDDMQSMCTKLWQWRVTDGPDIPPDWFAEEMSIQTAGLRRYIRELAVPLFERMAMDGISVPSRKYLREVADACLASVRPGVELLNRAYKGKVVDRQLLIRYEEYISASDYKLRVLTRAAEIRARTAVRSAARKRA
ncbi:ATP-binding protein [Paraburkholderia aspalathi]|uniref:AAA domain-containing protein n=1 Tax=Paraburkholderia aspalathi TaxID=1324617 RepID=A0A1I7ER77_9BURK|nr:ATP-binding protein [Paraburkholderia aspalathi]SFU26417.1 AAA domain-containing protein [Paraburkholderia aspalathi]